MTFPEISALRTCARVSSSNKSDADTAGRNLRSATPCNVARSPLTLPSPKPTPSPSLALRVRLSQRERGRGGPFSPCGGEGEDEGCSLKFHENGSMRNASG